jgi:hypothetical protein
MLLTLMILKRIRAIDVAPNQVAQLQTRDMEFVCYSEGLHVVNVRPWFDLRLPARQGIDQEITSFGVFFKHDHVHVFPFVLEFCTFDIYKYQVYLAIFIIIIMWTG